MKDSSSITNKIASILSIGILVLLIVIVSYVKEDPQIYPGLKEIGLNFYQNLTSIKSISAFLMTILRVFVVLLISLIVSFILSLLYYYNKITLAFLKPLIVIMKAAPLAAISVYIFIMVKGEVGKPLRPYLIAFLVTLPIVLEGFIGAIDNVPEPIVNELELTKGPKYYKFLKIYLPMIIPSIAITLLQTIGLSFKVLIMGEFICFSDNSVGLLIHEAFDNFDMGQLLAIVLEIVIIVIIGEYLIKKTKNHILKY